MTANVLGDLEQLGALDMAQSELLMDDVEIQRLLESVEAPVELSDEQYSDAWAPDKIGDGDAQAASTEAREVQGTTHGGVMVTAMTPAAVQATREREARINQARTEEEKTMARKDSNLYRLALIFEGEEADVIRAALGSQPAVKLLEMCRTAAGH